MQLQQQQSSALKSISSLKSSFKVYQPKSKEVIHITPTGGAIRSAIDTGYIKSQLMNEKLFEYQEGKSNNNLPSTIVTSGGKAHKYDEDLKFKESIKRQNEA